MFLKLRCGLVYETEMNPNCSSSHSSNCNFDAFDVLICITPHSVMVHSKHSQNNKICQVPLKLEDDHFPHDHKLTLVHTVLLLFTEGAHLALSGKK